MRTFVRGLELPSHSPLRFWAIVVFLLLLAVQWKQAWNGSQNQTQPPVTEQARR